MASTLELLRRLSTEKVEFVLVGGMAAIAHGSATVTEDVDLCIRFDLPTLTGVLRALAGTNPRERMNPLKPPVGEPARYVGYRNLYLVTDDGVLDLLSEILAVGDYPAVVANAVEMDLGGFSCRVIGLEDLIACTEDEHVRLKQMKKLNVLMMKVEAKRSSPSNIAAQDDYFRKVVERITLNSKQK